MVEMIKIQEKKQRNLYYIKHLYYSTNFIALNILQ